MDDFTTLERAVLEAICAARPQDGAALRRRLATARVLGRDNTGHGFYTSFRVSPDLPPLRTEARGIGGPLAWMESMGDGDAMGFVLWFEDGRPDGLGRRPARRRGRGDRRPQAARPVRPDLLATRAAG